MASMAALTITAAAAQTAGLCQFIGTPPFGAGRELAKPMPRT